MIRGVGVLLLVGVAGGLLAVSGRDPIGWVRDRWADLRGTLSPVADVTAVANPPRAVLPEYRPEWAVDNVLDRAWATTWGGGGSQDRTCGPVPKGGAATLLLTLPVAVELRAMEVAAGLSKDDPLRQLQWRPRVLQVQFASGDCRRYEIADRPDVQKIELGSVTTNAIRVAVAAAYPPKGGTGNRVAISEIRLLRRPE